MDDDEDNDQRTEEDEEDDNTIRTYSKKRLFGKTVRDIKAFTLKTNIKPRHEALKPFKITLEEVINKAARPVQSTSYLKMKHKDELGQNISTKSKFNLSLKNHHQLYNYDISNTLSTKLKQSTVSLHSRLNSKYEIAVKLSQAIKFWDSWKFKYGVEVQKKKDIGFNGNVEVQRRRNGQVPAWMQFATQYNQICKVAASGKFNGKHKFQTVYKGHIVTHENHKLYLQHRFGYDSTSTSPYSNTITANCQESQGIGTFNASLTFQNAVLKTKEFRFVIQFEKSLAFGLHRRNDTFQVMMQKSKIKTSWLKMFRVNIGNRGMLASVEGKLNLFRNYVDYAINYKLKPIQTNFYEDSSLGFTLKWNL